VSNIQGGGQGGTEYGPLAQGRDGEEVESELQVKEYIDIEKTKDGETRGEGGVVWNEVYKEDRFI
jgi:hypothetical protein